jgi:general secretion pathway protein B
MSFILDALKKAESERNRNTGPVLMDVRIAAPRRRLPTWAWVLGVVLVANLGILAWLLLRKPPAAPIAADAAAPAATATAPAPVAVTPLAAPGAATVPPLAASSSLPVTTAPQPFTTTPASAATALDTPEDYDNLPTAQDLIASGTALPPLQLNLHVYDASAVNRYVLLNSVRLREGDITSAGFKVERITPRGVVLNGNGRRFLLSAGG